MFVNILCKIYAIAYFLQNLLDRYMYEIRISGFYINEASFVKCGVYTFRFRKFILTFDQFWSYNLIGKILNPVRCSVWLWSLSFPKLVRWWKTHSTRTKKYGHNIVWRYFSCIPSLTVYCFCKSLFVKRV